MNLARAAMIRELSAEGRTAVCLARAFGVSDTLVRYILQGKFWSHNRCKGCEAPVSGNRWSGLCEQCKRQFCCHCAGPKSPHRASVRCAACDRLWWDRLVSKPGKLCRECGLAVPEERRDVMCTDCRQAEQEIYAEYRLRQDRKCRECGAPVPKWKYWTRALCSACADKHDRLRRSLARRYCSLCERQRIDDHRGSLCPQCARIDQQIKRIGTRVTPAEHLRYRQQELDRLKQRRQRAHKKEKQDA